MKFIIDMPEDVYKRTIFYKEFHNLNDYVTTIKALEKATPLQKGHGNIYDERDLEKPGNVYFQEEVITNDSNIVFRFPKLIINATPIIEEDRGE